MNHRPLSTFAHYFSDSYILCFVSQTGEKMMFVGGGQPVRLTSTTGISELRLDTLDEDRILRKLASEARNFSVDDRQERHGIIVDLSGAKVFVAMKSSVPTLLDFCLAYHSLASLIAERRKVGDVLSDSQ